MKIRYQFILVEAGISLVLFLSVLFSILLTVTYTRYRDFEIKTTTVQSSVIRSRYYLLEMLASVNPTASIISDYETLEEQLTRNIADLGESYVAKLAPDIRNEYQKVKVGWEETRKLLSTEDIVSSLGVRDEAGGYTNSLLSTQTRIQEESDLAERVSSAIERIILYENALIDFEVLLRDTMFSLSQIVERYRIRIFALVIAIPLIILLITFGGSLLFAAYLGRELTVLDKALGKVIRGDFSTRVEMKGDDEFTSLAGSINAFTETLGHKLESFRFIMHDIGSTLEKELEATQIESTQVESTLLKLAMKETTANGAAFYRVGSESNNLVLSTTEGKFRPPFAVSDLPDSPSEEDIEALLKSQIILLGETILGKSASEGKPIMIQDVEAEDKFDWIKLKDDPLYIASVIVVPLQAGSTVIGVLAITSNAAGNLFTDLEFVNLQSFAEIAAISLDNIYRYSDLLDSAAIEHDISIAEEIQRDLLPGKMPELSGASVAYLSRSMKGLNSDYFDVYSMSEGKVMLTICEVVSRGISASLVMVIIRTLLRISAKPDVDARSIMNKLNQDITKQVPIENYARVGIFLIDPDGQFTYSAASQNPARIFRSATNEIETLHIEEIPIGVDGNARFQQTIGKLEDRDLVLFHSDGIPESRDKNGNEFGVEKLLNIVKEQSESGLAQMVNVIRTELENFERDTQQQDDQTAIVFRFDGKKATGDAA